MDAIPDICDKMYAMGNMIASSLGVHIKVSEQSGKVVKGKQKVKEKIVGNAS